MLECEFKAREESLHFRINLCWGDLSGRCASGHNELERDVIQWLAGRIKVADGAGDNIVD